MSGTLKTKGGVSESEVLRGEGMIPVCYKDQRRRGWCAARRRLRGEGEKPVSGVDTIWCAESTDRPSSTRSIDPSGGGVDREGLTTSCTFVSREPPQGFNEDPEVRFRGIKTRFIGALQIPLNTTS